MDINDQRLQFIRDQVVPWPCPHPAHNAVPASPAPAFTAGRSIFFYIFLLQVGVQHTINARGEGDEAPDAKLAALFDGELPTLVFEATTDPNANPKHNPNPNPNPNWDARQRETFTR